MYNVEILNPNTGEVIENRSFNSEYEAIMYGEMYKEFIENYQRYN
jgi:hypothetical protein